MATVGMPRPTTPFTAPATKNVRQTKISVNGANMRWNGRPEGDRDTHGVTPHGVLA